ncbi:MAG: 8-amino-7-oxononanoate synthase [Bacillus thermozeamaize]|uniref:8-amino-7-ketopelargonate synthase n=1 Tax=Bacillus thermozeamaize TaxID=230954 RepID=A0A1Y3PJY3_9BACI|nr:MAG: 8-amino-7-oxononanoate synthase [Bacillus thermozeamaize]
MGGICPVNSSWETFLQEQLERLEESGRLRTLQPVEGAQQPVLRRGDKRLINLSSNNYLGLADHPVLKEAAARAAIRGSGATASRLIVGHDLQVAALEEKLAAFKGTEAALLFGSGYLANVGVLSALLGRGDVVFSDELNHASIIDGIRLSKADCYRYQHRDMDHLETLLKQAAQRGFRRRLIVTDSVFSMDGDVAPLREIVWLKNRYNAALMVDEAHGGGVFGPHGEGYATHAGVSQEVDLTMGTFSKAFGVYGAYVAGGRDWIRYLINTCRSFIYTTALPPAVVGAIDAAVDLVQSSHQLRKALMAKAERFRRRLREMGFDTAGSSTQIIPVVIGGNREAVAFSRALEELGVLGVAIRPPTVPEGTARIRFSLMANHDDEDLDVALAAIGAVGEKMGLI